MPTAPLPPAPTRVSIPGRSIRAPRGVGAKRRELLSGYYASITAVDQGVGALVAWLNAHGLAEQTLILFTSDNGMNMGHHGIWGKGNGTFPQNMYDTSVKVPFIAAHAGHTPAGAVATGLFSHYDVLPTLLEYLGLGSTVPRGLPGRSFAPLLRGEDTPACDHIVVCDEYGPVRMIRTTQWKYVHRYPYGPHELYTLATDPDEHENRIDDAGVGALIAELRHALEVWFCRFANLERDGARQPVTGKGQFSASGRRVKVARLSLLTGTISTNMADHGGRRLADKVRLKARNRRTLSALAQVGRSACRSPLRAGHAGSVTQVIEDSIYHCLHSLCMWQFRSGPAYVLEMFNGETEIPALGTGRIVRINSNGLWDVLATGLRRQRASPFGPENGALYVAQYSYDLEPGQAHSGKGQIVRIDVSEPMARRTLYDG